MMAGPVAVFARRKFAALSHCAAMDWSATALPTHAFGAPPGPREVIELCMVSKRWGTLLFTCPELVATKPPHRFRKSTQPFVRSAKINLCFSWAG
jgi:hypothetical protein